MNAPQANQDPELHAGDAVTAPTAHHDIVVVSTGLRCSTRSWCLESVQKQTGVSVLHLVVDAEQWDPPKSKIENLRAAIAPLPADQIVCVVDLDDWLIGPGALARVVEEHRAGAWATYGSFEYADGRRGFAAQVFDPRHGPWTATHLKSFRAGLFQAIRPEDLRGPEACGGWIDRADDLAYMLPILEMAAERARFIADVLYVYNFGHSFEFTATPAARAHEQDCAAWVRARPAYASLRRLPGSTPGAPFDETLP